MKQLLAPTLLAALALILSRGIAAQETHDGAERRAKPAAHAAPAESREGETHDVGPLVPPHDTRHVWPTLVLMGIGLMFVFAAVIGPITRMHAPPAEMPPTHSHDEPPGASHHHGAGGTLNPEPDHGHGHGHH
jgi:hypothetical protein